MSKLMRSCAMAALIVGLAAASSANAAPAECKNFAAVGSGLSNSIASLMAKQGAVNVAEGRGYHVQGDAKLISCSSGGIFGVECKASTHACK
jgi:hypothetical protein